eukprot:834524-Prymnesium_polylepis.1
MPPSGTGESVCLIFGQEGVGTAAYSFCSVLNTDKNAWCKHNLTPTQDQKDKRSFSVLVQVGMRCCVDGVLTGNPRCPSNKSPPSPPPSLPPDPPPKPPDAPPPPPPPPPAPLPPSPIQLQLLPPTEGPARLDVPFWIDHISPDLPPRPPCRPPLPPRHPPPPLPNLRAWIQGTQESSAAESARHQSLLLLLFLAVLLCVRRVMCVCSTHGAGCGRRPQRLPLPLARPHATKLFTRLSGTELVDEQQSLHCHDAVLGEAACTKAVDSLPQSRAARITSCCRKCVKFQLRPFHKLVRQAERATRRRSEKKRKTRKKALKVNEGGCFCRLLHALQSICGRLSTRRRQKHFKTGKDRKNRHRKKSRKEQAGESDEIESSDSENHTTSTPTTQECKKEQGLTPPSLTGEASPEDAPTSERDVPFGTELQTNALRIGSSPVQVL